MSCVYKGNLVRVMHRKARHGMDEDTYWVQTRNTSTSGLWFDSLPKHAQHLRAYGEPFDSLEEAKAFAQLLEAA